MGPYRTLEKLEPVEKKIPRVIAEWGDNRKYRIVATKSGNAIAGYLEERDYDLLGNEIWCHINLVEDREKSRYAFNDLLDALANGMLQMVDP